MPTQTEIERRAFELYEQRGRENGYDRDDWLLAEAQLRNAEGPAVRAVRDRATNAMPRRRGGERTQRTAAS
jgi:hypothetical protein